VKKREKVSFLFFNFSYLEKRKKEKERGETISKKLLY